MLPAAVAWRTCYWGGEAAKKQLATKCSTYYIVLPLPLVHTEQPPVDSFFV